MASVTVVPFSIEPHHIEGTAARPSPAALLQALADEAVASAARALTRSHISSKVDLAPAKAGMPVYRLTGTVRIPLFLPEDEQLHREIGRSEPFVKASILLLDPDGRELRKVESILAWEDLHGPDGAPLATDGPVESVLRQAVRQAVEDAVDHLGPIPTRN
ncbi:MAG: hypothetical protein ABUT39_06310 [Acidobacteriota bacterium]